MVIPTKFSYMSAFIGYADVVRGFRTLHLFLHTILEYIACEIANYIALQLFKENLIPYSELTPSASIERLNWPHFSMGW